MENLKEQRNFMAVILASLAVFGIMVVFWQGANANIAPDSGKNLSNNTGNISGGQMQDIYIKALSNGTYDKQQVTVKKGVPVRLHFSADPNAGCGKFFVIYGLGVDALSRNGEEATVDFTPAKEGTFQYNCAMRMWRGGNLVVVP